MFLGPKTPINQKNLKKMNSNLMMTIYLKINFQRLMTQIIHIDWLLFVIFSKLRERVFVLESKYVGENFKETNGEIWSNISSYKELIFQSYSPLFDKIDNKRTIIIVLITHIYKHTPNSQCKQKVAEIYSKSTNQTIE